MLLETTTLGQTPLYLGCCCRVKTSGKSRSRIQFQISLVAWVFSLPLASPFFLSSHSEKKGEGGPVRSSRCTPPVTIKTKPILAFSLEHELFHSMTNVCLKADFHCRGGYPFVVNTSPCSSPLCVGESRCQRATGHDGSAAQTARPWWGKGVIHLCEHIRQLRASHTCHERHSASPDPSRVPATLQTER